MDEAVLIKILFAELVEDLGGTVHFNAAKILDDMRKGKFKDIGFHIEGDIAIVKVFDNEDED